MSEHRVGSFSVGALNPGSLPLKRVYGQGQVSITEMQCDYQGPGGTLYVIFGFKKGTGDFNNGQNLLDGIFQFQAVGMPVSPSAPQHVTLSMASMLSMYKLPSAVVGRKYDAYVWMSTEPSADESKFVRRLDNPAAGVIDTDAGVLEIVSDVAKAGGMNVRWA